MEKEPNMSGKIKAAGIALLSVGAAAVIAFAGNLGQQTQAQESAQDKDAMPLGRTPAAITDGQYPASYFPNTELLGADEMRITALGTGMPNQTKAAVSIAYLVELGNGDKFIFVPTSPSSTRSSPATSTSTTWATSWACTSAAGCRGATRRSTSTGPAAPRRSWRPRPSSRA
jgi:uncharacterized protein (DUF3084 family)